MSNQQLNLALENYFKDEITERTKEFEECKKAAFEIWENISQIREDIAPKTMKLCISEQNIKLKCDVERGEIIRIFPYDNAKILTLVSIIAGNSDIKGKIFSQRDSLSLKFCYN